MKKNYVSDLKKGNPTNISTGIEKAIKIYQEQRNDWSIKVSFVFHFLHFVTCK